MSTLIERIPVAVLMVVSMAGVGGCAGGGSAGIVDLPAAQRHRLTAALPANAVIKLPADTPYNVHDKRWGSTPGLDGKAVAAADATASGTAYAAANAENGGVSWGEFQLGHSLENETGKALAAELRMTIDYEYVCRAAGGAKTAGVFSLKAYVKGSDGKVIQMLPLAGHTTDDGPVRWSGTERTVSEITMQSGLGYTIVLVGRTDATSQEKASCAAEIRIKSLAIEIACKPATTPATTQGR